MDGGAVDAGQHGRQPVVVVEQAQAQRHRHEHLQAGRPVLGLVADQDHVSHPLGHVIEVRDHAVHVAQAAARLLLVQAERHVPHQIPDADAAEHDPIDARNLVGHILGVHAHEYMVPVLVERQHRRGHHGGRLALVVFVRVELEVRGG